MLGERVSAETAERWKMIWRQVAPGALMDEAIVTAARLAQMPPRVRHEVRQAFDAAQLNPLTAQMEHERLRQHELLDRPSFPEGFRAFKEKRNPNFVVV